MLFRSILIVCALSLSLAPMSAQSKPCAKCPPKKQAAKSPRPTEPEMEAKGAPAGPLVVVLPLGTTVRLETTEVLSSERASRGMEIKLRVTTDVRVDGHVLIRTGALAFGRVVEVRDQYSPNDPATISIVATQVQTVEGNIIDLNGSEQTIVGETPRTVVRIEPMHKLSAGVMNNSPVRLD